MELRRVRHELYLVTAKAACAFYNRRVWEGNIGRFARQKPGIHHGELKLRRKLVGAALIVTEFADFA
jgi:hypothetical protein